MKIGILISSQLFEAFTGIERLEAAAKELGHEAVRLLERKISFEEIGEKLVAKYDGRQMPELDVIIVRPNFVEEPSQHQFIYDLLTRAGYRLVNGGAGITRTKNKILQRHDLRAAGIPMPKWAVAYGVEGCLEAVKSLGYPVIVKMAFGTRGKGVFFADTPEVLAPIADYLNVRDGNPVILEEFIAEAHRAHVRVFVVNGEVVAGMEVIAPQGDVRSNAGGVAQQTALSPEEHELAVKAAQAMGLAIAGVDIIRSSRGPLVMEVNANPGFSNLEGVAGVDVAKKIIAFVAK